MSLPPAYLLFSSPSPHPLHPAISPSLLLSASEHFENWFEKQIFALKLLWPLETLTLKERAVSETITLPWALHEEKGEQVFREENGDAQEGHSEKTYSGEFSFKHGWEF